MGAHVRAAVAVTTMVLALLVAACGEAEDVELADSVSTESTTAATGPEGATTEVAPFGARWGGGAGAGSDLVLLGPWEDRTAALRRADGTWADLPRMPFRGVVASAGDRVVLAGWDCDLACGSGRIGMAMLKEDRSGWDVLDEPNVDITGDTEMTPAPGPSDLAQFRIGSMTYWVDEDGKVLDWTPQPIDEHAGEGVTEIGCRAGDEYFSVQHEQPDLERPERPSEMGLIGEVHVQPFRGDAPPEPAVPLPPGPGPWNVTYCAGGVLALLGGDIHAHLDLATRTWTTGPADHVNGNPPDGAVSPIGARLAVEPSGTAVPTVYATWGRAVSRQTGPAPWQEARLWGHVFATDTEVLVIGDDGTVTRAWPA